MLESLRKVIANKKLVIIVLCLALVSFNNWIISLFFHKSLLLRGGEISELSVRGQPHELLFRSLDIVAGVLFIALAISLAASAIKKTKSFWALLITMVVLGLANITDAVFPLNCSETLNQNCKVPVNINTHHFVFPRHGYSSVLIAVCYVLLPIIGYLIGRVLSSPRLKMASVVTFVATAYANAAVIFEFVVHNSYKLPRWAISQQVQMLLLSVWFLFLYSLLMIVIVDGLKEPALVNVRKAVSDGG